jgi:protoporphyrinogen IX oxidase
MDIVFDLLLMAHLLSLLAAGAVVVVMPMIGARMAGASPETRGILGGVAQRIGLFSRIAFGVLLVSGPLMVWIRFGGVEGMTVWFWIKMALIVLMAIGMGVGGRVRARAKPGDARAVAIAKVATNVSRLSLVGIIVAAVLAFN